MLLMNSSDIKILQISVSKSCNSHLKRIVLDLIFGMMLKLPASKQTDKT